LKAEVGLEDGLGRRVEVGTQAREVGSKVRGRNGCRYKVEASIEAMMGAYARSYARA
jgi:hypothetical protein